MNRRSFFPAAIAALASVRKVAPRQMIVTPAPLRPPWGVLCLDGVPQFRDGNPVFFEGRQFGTFHGDAGTAGRWYVTTIAVRDMPPKLAERFRVNSPHVTA